MRVTKIFKSGRVMSSPGFDFAGEVREHDDLYNIEKESCPY